MDWAMGIGRGVSPEIKKDCCWSRRHAGFQ